MPLSCPAIAVMSEEPLIIRTDTKDNVKRDREDKIHSVIRNSLLNTVNYLLFNKYRQ